MMKKSTKKPKEIFLKKNDKIYNSDKTRYLCLSLGNYFDERFEIWEKDCKYWSLRFWTYDFHDAYETWNKIKDELPYSVIRKSMFQDISNDSDELPF